MLDTDYCDRRFTESRSFELIGGWVHEEKLQKEEYIGEIFAKAT